MKSFKFDFAKQNNSIPMIDFLESLSIKESALILKNIEKLIESPIIKISELYEKGHLSRDEFELQKKKLI